MRSNRLLFAFVAAGVWIAPLSGGRLDAQPNSAFEQLEQQVQRENARDAAGLPQGPKAQGQEPGYLGIIADDRETAGKGIKVTETIADGPADKAGLKAGDVVTGIDGQPMHSMQDFERLFSGQPAGKKLAFQVTRDEQAITIDVTLGQRPPPGQRRFEQFGPIPTPENIASTPLENRGATLGVRMANVTPDLQQSMNLPGATGALVVMVVQGSAADKAGIKAGNVIVSIDKQPVASTADLSRLIAKHSAGQEITVGLFNGKTMVDLKAVLGGAIATPSGEAPIAGPGAEQPQALGSPPLPGAGGGMPGLPGGPPMQNQFGVPNHFGGPNQFGNPYTPGMPAGPGDRLQMLEQRVQDLERRVHHLEEQLKQPASESPKATQSGNKQT